MSTRVAICWAVFVWAVVARLTFVAIWHVRWRCPRDRMMKR